MRIPARIVLTATVACAGHAFAQAAPAPAVPDLSGFFNHNPNDSFGSPPSGLGPVINVFKGRGRGMWHGDHTNPMLQPWAAEVVRKQAEMERAETPNLTSQQMCMPSGVPNIHQLPDTLQILQTPNHVAIVYARDHQIRIVNLNAKHPENLTPSWYGDSIGHYEGDTLVVDTVGMNDKTWTDRMGTPHTDKIHVVERYHVINNGRVLRADFTVTDPGAFTAPWSGYMDYQRNPRGAIDEQACAENPPSVASHSRRRSKAYCCSP